MPISLLATDVDQSLEEVRAESAQDLRICGVFVISIVIGTGWFYLSVMCSALRLL